MSPAPNPDLSSLCDYTALAIKTLARKSTRVLALSARENEFHVRSSPIRRPASSLNQARSIQPLCTGANRL